jgi:hypothetical protein
LFYSFNFDLFGCIFVIGAAKSCDDEEDEDGLTTAANGALSSGGYQETISISITLKIKCS